MGHKPSKQERALKMSDKTLSKEQKLLDVLAGRTVTLSESYVFTVNRQYIGWYKREVVIDRGKRKTFLYPYKVIYWRSINPEKAIYAKWRNSRLAHRYWLYKAMQERKLYDKIYYTGTNIPLHIVYEQLSIGSFYSLEECRSQFWECAKLYFLRKLL